MPCRPSGALGMALSHFYESWVVWMLHRYMDKNYHETRKKKEVRGPWIIVVLRFRNNRILTSINFRQYIMFDRSIGKSWNWKCLFFAYNGLVDTLTESWSTCILDRCTMPLGMEDHRILSGHLRASSSYNYNHGPDRARLNIVNGHGRTGAWVARHQNTKQFLQIDLRQLSLIKGIATQGRREAHQWVKSYTLSYSRTGLRFNMYAAYGRIKVRIVWFFSLLRQIFHTALIMLRGYPFRVRSRTVYLMHNSVAH